MARDIKDYLKNKSWVLSILNQDKPMTMNSVKGTGLPGRIPLREALGHRMAAGSLLSG